MEITTLIVGALAGHRGGRALAPKPVRVWGAALLFDSFPHARDSALTGIDMV